MQYVQQGAERAGRQLDHFRNCALTNIVLLEPGEAVDSERVIRLIGPNVMASFYYFFDEVHEKDIEPPEFLKKYWKRYCDLVAATPSEHWHFRTHEYHYTYLHPGEAELIDADLIRATCLVGTADELVEQIRDLERQGLQELMFATGNDEKWHVAEAFARQVMAKL
jgi:alkanesulfonate monooxygenase SsuD/methylene tetrahydromethanopterin reductase-like flavin-dependent oxidoreductase (luciferase family)